LLSVGFCSNSGSSAAKAMAVPLLVIGVIGLILWGIGAL